MSETVAGVVAREEEGRRVNEGLTEELAVSSDGIFGPTFQGEGPSLGTPCFFLRLGGCNQHCVWCDTPYTWAFSDALAAKHQSGKRWDPRVEITKRSGQSLIDELREKKKAAGLRAPSMLVISGGEPLLQQRKLAPMMEALAAEGWTFEIETAGTIGPIREVSRITHQFNVSPKLENSGNPLTQRYKIQALRALMETHRAVFKFVVVEMDDLKEIDHIVNDALLFPVYVMPEGVSADAINSHSQAIAAEVLKRGWNLTTRLQILLYGNQRGV